MLPCELLGHPFTLACIKGRQPLAALLVTQNAKRLRELLHAPVIVALPTVAPGERKQLIHHGIAFVVPDRQFFRSGSRTSETSTPRSVVAIRTPPIPVFCATCEPAGAASRPSTSIRWCHAGCPAVDRACRVRQKLATPWRNARTRCPGDPLPCVARCSRTRQSVLPDPVASGACADAPERRPVRDGSGCA